MIRNPPLNKSELLHGCEMLIDSGADSFVVENYRFVTETIEGISVSAQGFSDSQPTIDDLPIVNALYAYDNTDSGKTILLEVNYCIYLGLNKVDVIACPKQMRSHGLPVDERPTTLPLM